MRWTRRQWIAGSLAAAAHAQQPPETLSRPPAPLAMRATPMVCLYSQLLGKLHYSDLGAVVRDLGFEGCDLSLRPGGHVRPELASADLLRAIEGLRGDGIVVPMISTPFTSPGEPAVRPVLGIAGAMSVGLFRPGYWKYTGAADIDARLAEVKRDLLGLAVTGRAYGIAMGIHNQTGENFGAAVWDTRASIADIDPRWVGYCFDPAHATAEGGVGGWSVALRAVLPRIKMVALQDFYWAREGKQAQMRLCPMGEGMVDWQQVFGMLARGRFTGPLTLHVEYSPKDEVGAVRRDLEFVRKQVEAAYGSQTRL